MTLRIDVVLEPLDEPALARAAVEMLALAEAMGLVPEDEVVERLDVPAVRRVVRAASRAGIGAAALPALTSGALSDPGNLRSAIEAVTEALEESPLPEGEWRSLIDTLGPELLAELLGLHPTTVRRYASAARATPDDVAARLHFLAKVVADLRGAYNEIGIRRWFGRKRSLLGNRSPAQILRSRWDPDGASAARVRELSRSLVAVGGT